MLFLFRWWKRFSIVAGTKSWGQSSQLPVSAARSEECTPETTLLQRFNNVAGTKTTDPEQGPVPPAAAAVQSLLRTPQATFLQPFGNVAGTKVMGVEQSVTARTAAEVRSAQRTPPTTLLQRFDNVVSTKMTDREHGVTAPAAAVVRMERRTPQTTLRPGPGNVVHDGDGTPTGTNEQVDDVGQANPKLHALLFLRWLRTHEWPDRRELVGESAAENSYKEFCAFELLQQPIPWRSVARHFNRITRSPGSALKPCRLTTDQDGVCTRVRVYIVPTSPTKAERATEAELNLEVLKSSMTRGDRR